MSYRWIQGETACIKPPVTPQYSVVGLSCVCSPVILYSNPVSQLAHKTVVLLSVLRINCLLYVHLYASPLCSTSTDACRRINAVFYCLTSGSSWTHWLQCHEDPLPQQRPWLYKPRKREAWFEGTSTTGELDPGESTAFVSRHTRTLFMFSLFCRVG